MRQGAFTLVRFLSTIGFGLALTIGSGSVCAQRVLLDRIVALVDEGVVLQSELNARIIEIRGNAARANSTLPEVEQLRTEVLDSLIIENLQMQLAESKYPF
jgi:peptidyl-prolyl cis-trans isomerase SurA